MRWIVAVSIAMVLSSAVAADDGSKETARKTLADHQTVAKLTGVAFEKCRGRTADCPDKCGHSGDFATFEIVAYLSYKKPGQYGDDKQKTFSFQIEDNQKNLKVDKALAEAVRGLKAGDYVLLDWHHDYVTKTWPEGGQANGPERPVMKVEKITKEQADKLILAAATAATQPATASRPASGTSAGRTALDYKVRKADDKVVVTGGDGKEVFSIASPSGIGGMTISRDADPWPQVVVRLALRSMECLEVSCGESAVKVEVSSHGDAAVSQHAMKNNKEGRALDKDSALWLAVKVLDASGKAVKGAPGESGCFEVTIPKAMLEGASKVLKLSWIDAYR